MGLLVGVLVETVSTVATLEREQLDIDFAQKVLWEMIDKGGADEDGDNRISETEYVNLLSRPVGVAVKLQHIFEVQKTPGICTSILGQTPCRTMVASMKTGKSRIKIGGFHGKLI